MKLLQIICIEEYGKEVTRILKRTGVQAFSYMHVKGFKSQPKKTSKSWFMSDDIPTDSILFIAYIEQECMKEIFEEIELFNVLIETQSKLHVVCSPIDDSNF